MEQQGTIERYREAERQRRNQELKERLSEGKSFEELLEELAALKGFNVKERLAAAA